MNLHEYQAKQLFNRYGIATPNGQMISSIEEVDSALAAIGGERWVIKAQVHSGGRGKAGGVRVEDSTHAVKEAAKAMLGSQMVTHQTTAEGLPVNKVWIETPSSIERELYLALLVDRVTQRVVFMISAEGGMDIEEVAEKNAGSYFESLCRSCSRSATLPMPSGRLLFAVKGCCLQTVATVDAKSVSTVL